MTLNTCPIWRTISILIFVEGRSGRGKGGGEGSEEIYPTSRTNVYCVGDSEASKASASEYRMRVMLCHVMSFAVIPPVIIAGSYSHDGGWRSFPV